MTRAGAARANSQAGYTLVELLVASALSVIVMTGLAELVYTAWHASLTATGRVEASSQLRSFEFYAYDDFALSTVPAPTGCGGSSSSACTTQPIVLQGLQAANVTNPTTSPYQVTYTWDGSGTLDRQVGSGPPRHAATGVTAFAWYVDGSNQTVVVTMSVTAQSYTETQTLRFYPRVNP